jgi:hypothetical protein
VYKWYARRVTIREERALWRFMPIHRARWMPRGAKSALQTPAFHPKEMLAFVAVRLKRRCGVTQSRSNDSRLSHSP